MKFSTYVVAALGAMVTGTLAQQSSAPPNPLSSIGSAVNSVISSVASGANRYVSSLADIVPAL